METKMYIRVKAHKSVEGNCYYCDLPNGERLIIRKKKRMFADGEKHVCDGEIEGIYNPNLAEVI